MPWVAEAPYLASSDAEPRLPIGPDHAALAVDPQEADAGSLLAPTRTLLACPAALRTGEMRIIEASDTILAFERATPGQRLLCVFNVSDVDQAPRLDDSDGWESWAKALASASSFPGEGRDPVSGRS